MLFYYWTFYISEKGSEIIHHNPIVTYCFLTKVYLCAMGGRVLGTHGPVTPWRERQSISSLGFTKGPNQSEIQKCITQVVGTEPKWTLMYLWYFFVRSDIPMCGDAPMSSLALRGYIDRRCWFATCDQCLLNQTEMQKSGWFGNLRHEAPGAWTLLSWFSVLPACQSWSM